MPSRLDAACRHPLLLTALWAGCVGVVAFLARRFWIPLDDGTLAQAAERVLTGELPHRDFADPYTGLGAAVGAVAFHLFGTSLAALRVPLVAAFALWLPAVWLLLRRFATPPVALAATLLAAVLSIPTYPAAMPTWYGLFAATWGLAFLARGLDGGGRRWLAAAGACAGVSFLFKVTGLYLVAAALLALAWHRRGGRAWAVACLAGSAGFLVLLGRLVLPGASPAGVAHFFLPAAALCLALALRARSAWRAPREAIGDGAQAPRALPLDVAAFAAGAVIPVALFLVPYAATGSLAGWWDGVFVRPTIRLGAAASGPGAAWTVLPGAVAVGLVAWSEGLAEAARRRLAWGTAGALALALASDDLLGGAAFEALWYGLRSWIPALTVWGAWKALGAADPAVFAAVATAGLWALVQFPYSAPAYLFYAAPLGVVATVAAAWGAGRADAAGFDRREAPGERIRASGAEGPRPLLAVAGVVALLLGGGYAWGVARAGEEPLLPGGRGGILVPARDAALYRTLVQVVDAHRSGGAVWATPDAPEVYFLAGASNPTRTMYEFLTPEDRPPDPSTLDAIVVNTRPLFSAPVSEALLRRLDAAGFATGARVGPFDVRWRSPP